MKNLLKLVGIMTGIGILASVYIWFFVYNKPHANYETANAEYVITANDCYLNYSEKGGAIDYNGKVLQISGVPTRVETTDSLTIIVFSFHEGMFGEEGVRCTLLPNNVDAVGQLDLSKEITIKGFCSGYNETDVILQYCSIINN